MFIRTQFRVYSRLQTGNGDWPNCHSDGTNPISGLFPPPNWKRDRPNCHSDGTNPISGLSPASKLYNCRNFRGNLLLLQLQCIASLWPLRLKLSSSWSESKAWTDLVKPQSSGRQFAVQPLYGPRQSTADRRRRKEICSGNSARRRNLTVRRFTFASFGAESVCPRMNGHFNGKATNHHY